MKYVRNLLSTDPNFADQFDAKHPKVVVSNDEGSSLSVLTLAEYKSIAEGYQAPPVAVKVKVEEPVSKKHK